MKHIKQYNDNRIIKKNELRELTTLLRCESDIKRKNN